MFSAKQLGISEEREKELNKIFDCDGCRWEDSNFLTVYENRVKKLASLTPSRIATGEK